MSRRGGEGIYNPSPAQLLETANMWEQRAEDHIRAADFCHEQASRFLGRIAVPDDYRPHLVLIHGDKDNGTDRTDFNSGTDTPPDGSA